MPTGFRCFFHARLSLVKMAVMCDEISNPYRRQRRSPEPFEATGMSIEEPPCEVCALHKVAVATSAKLGIPASSLCRQNSTSRGSFCQSAVHLDIRVCTTERKALVPRRSS